MFKTIKKGLLAALMIAGVGTFAPSALAQEEAQEAEDIIYQGDAKCTSCHDEYEVAPVLSIAKTKHGVTKDGRVPSCTTCHGESEAHVNKPEDVQVRPAPDVFFSKKSHLTPEQQSATCMSCHQGGKHMNWNSSTHAARDVSCTSCHQVHTGHDKVRDELEQPQVCYSCHKQQRAELTRPSHHPIPEGKMTCSDCHNVHGDNPKQLLRNSVNETCYSCHMEKRGPFVHNHQPVAEDCGSCHNPHGTTTASLLKSRPPFLCQECHSQSSHPSQAAGLPTAPGVLGSTATGTVARGCLNCHTNIHGSNSTQDAITTRRFRY